MFISIIKDIFNVVLIVYQGKWDEDEEKEK